MMFSFGKIEIGAALDAMSVLPVLCTISFPMDWIKCKKRTRDMHFGNEFMFTCNLRYEAH